MGAACLRPTTADDLLFVIRAEQDPENRPFIVPWTHERHAAALEDADIAHLILEHESLGPVGSLILAGLASPHGSIELRRLVVTAKGQGLGRAAVQLVKRLAFARKDVHRLWLDVKTHNRRARSLYESEGFVVEGVLRECLRGGSGFESLVVMSKLDSEHR